VLLREALVTPDAKRKAIRASVVTETSGERGSVRLERYRGTRYWAVYDGEELVCVTVYKKGARVVRDRLEAENRMAVSSGEEAVSTLGEASVRKEVICLK
jgi:hypothetical protein